MNILVNHQPLASNMQRARASALCFWKSGNYRRRRESMGPLSNCGLRRSESTCTKGDPSHWLLSHQDRSFDVTLCTCFL